jgi:hypothetical protein
MVDFTIIDDKKYIKIASAGGWCAGCVFGVGGVCEFPLDTKGYSNSQCSNPSIIYREYKEPEQQSLTKVEVIAAIYSETPIECSWELPVSKQSYFVPHFLLAQELDLDEKVIAYIQYISRQLIWRYKKVPKVLSVTTRKFLQRGPDDTELINIWSTHWETPHDEVPTIIKSFIRWLEEPQTTTHEI